MLGVAAMDFLIPVIGVVLLVAFLIGVGTVFLYVRYYRKVEQGTALIVTGGTHPTVHFSKAIVWPLVRQAEIMDLSLRRIEIARQGSEGLICKDNVRADIKVAFFLRVNNTTEDVLKVAQSVGARRASQIGQLIELFDAKFSEALKTVGKHFDFVELYTSRERFKEQILKIIGRDLNGYVLDDAAIDYLEQTPIEKLNPHNILDAEGIKKISDLTSQQLILANHINREKEKTIKKQDVEAREKVLELERQQAEAEEKQHREIAVQAARERAESAKVQHEERLKAERARIITAEEVAIAEENMQRQVIVAQRSKERTDAIEKERITRDRDLEVTDRQRVVSLAEIEKERALETERRSIQEVIRERVVVERATVEEEEKIKDTREMAQATRAKRVAVTVAEQHAQELLVKQTKAAEASRDAARFNAEQEVIGAEARRAAAEKDAAGKKLMAEGIIAEEAALGSAEAQVIEKKALAEARGIEAKASAIEKQGTAEAEVLQRKAVAEARGLEAHAVATEKQGAAEASVLQQKLTAEAEGIREKADAMKQFHEAGKEHEEFKLRLEKDKAIELAAIDAQRGIAEQQAVVVGKALQSAKIDIVGGETEFFDRITSAVASGKAVDRWVGNSRVLSDVKATFFNGQPGAFEQQLSALVQKFNVGSDDIKNLSIAALIAKLMGMTDDEPIREQLRKLLAQARGAGLADNKANLSAPVA
jgi:uncharacterized membrane protein YqiK